LTFIFSPRWFTQCFKILERI